MAPNIDLLGAVYSAVPAVLLPKQGGGTASFTDVTDTTAAAADVASGKYFYTAAGVLTAGTASGGGGGASNLVTGTFKGTTSNTAMDVTLNYSGSGYPIVVVIYPTEGPYNSETGTFYSLVKRYATAFLLVVKDQTDTTPSYDGTGSANKAVYQLRYKSSTSNATTYGGTAYNDQSVYHDTAAMSGTSQGFRIRSKTKMSVFIQGTSYGFAANIEYTYWVIYSS